MIASELPLAGTSAAVPDDLIDGLNPEQAAAVRTLHGPLAVIAGPGAGKTRVLTSRIAALVRTSSAWPSQILAVTFTNKAAGEMKERLGGLLGDDTVAPMWVCTFHSMCAKLLRIEHAAAGLPKAYTIVDAGDVRSILTAVLRELGLADDRKAARAQAAAISAAKNGAPTRPDPQTAQVYEAYQNRLARLGALDFDDLLLRTMQLLETNGDVLQRYADKFRYILVDEYQDTNPVQYRLVQLLATAHRNLCVVGDADQAIYGFRSATPAALQAFTDDWPDANVVMLGRNYRSTPQVLETCQAIIDPNPAKHRPTLTTDRPDGPPVRLVVCGDDRDEAALVVDELRHVPSSARVAVLSRTNAQTRPFEEALMRAGMLYTVVGTLRFYDRAEIKDAMAYLKLIANPLDAVALTRAVSAPRRGIGPKALETVAAQADGGDLLAAARRGLDAGQLGRGTKAWGEFLAHSDMVVAAARSGGPADAVRAVLDGGVTAHTRQTGGDSTTDRLENLDGLVGAAEDFAARSDTSDPWEQTTDFLAHVALVSAADAVDTHGHTPRVELMTVHASKGKEFDHVYVIGVEESLFPHSRAEDAADEAEERRLLFVACSRARQTLTISRAGQRFLHGAVVGNEPSRFLDDLPAAVEVLHRGHVRSAARNDVPSLLGRPAGRPAARPAPRAMGSSAATAAGTSRTRARSGNAGPRLEAAQAAVGAHVRHSKFGDGKITSIETSASQPTVQVRFNDGTRLLRLDLAPLALVRAAG